MGAKDYDVVGRPMGGPRTPERKVIEDWESLRITVNLDLDPAEELEFFEAGVLVSDEAGDAAVAGTGSVEAAGEKVE